MQEISPNGIAMDCENISRKHPTAACSRSDIANIIIIIIATYTIAILTTVIIIDMRIVVLIVDIISIAQGDLC